MSTSRMPRGTAPAGVRPGDEAAASRYVRHMFGRVAPRYDFLNHLLSFQFDRYWRRFTARKLREVASSPDARILDLCCGTGDLIKALRRVHPGPMFGSDFSRPMLEAAAHKLERSARLVEADALSLPLPGNSFDLVTIAFGLRNLANYGNGLAEMHRVLRPGGTLAVLEFSQPRGAILGRLYRPYFRYVLPRIGNAISGAGNAYGYLQQSVDAFPSPEELSTALKRVGFGNVRYWPLTGGIAVLHLAVKR